MIAALAFYAFAAVLVGSAVMVVTSRNPVHSVLFLILAFFNAAGLFLIAGAEFLAMILVIVYVGAVAVLFLFVVMMLDIDFARLREGFQRYAPVGALIGLQCSGARAHSLHGLHLSVSGLRLDPAGGDDRRHCVDTTRQAQFQAAEYRRADRACRFRDECRGADWCWPQAAWHPAPAGA